MISVSHLTKRYGDFTAVEDLSFTIDDGHVYGFLGPNGAGKSTTMNIMTGCLSATAGKVEIDGCDIFEEPKEAKSRIGYLPEQPPLYMSESPLEYLRFVGEAKGLRGEELRRQIAEVTEQTGIETVRNRRISDLSKGYRQRVGIAQALLGNPKVIILDEPTVGLDPIQIIEIRDLIRRLGETHTVIFSSHILSEVQAICDQILIIHKGKLVAFGPPAELEQKLLAPGEILLTAEASPEEAAALLRKIPGIAEMETAPCQAGTKVTLQGEGSDLSGLCREIFFAFAGAGKALLELSPKRASLEDLFLQLTEDGPERLDTPEEETETKGGEAE